MSVSAETAEYRFGLRIHAAWQTRSGTSDGHALEREHRQCLPHLILQVLDVEMRVVLGGGQLRESPTLPQQRRAAPPDARPADGSQTRLAGRCQDLLKGLG